MNTVSYIILGVFLLLNIVGMVLYMITHKNIKFTSTWWINVIWTLFAGVARIPAGIRELKEMKKK